MVMADTYGLCIVMDLFHLEGVVAAQGDAVLDENIDILYRVVLFGLDCVKTRPSNGASQRQGDLVDRRIPICAIG